MEERGAVASCSRYQSIQHVHKKRAEAGAGSGGAMFSSSLITTVGLSVRCVGGLRGWAAWVGGPHNGISTVISCRYQVPGIVPVERWVGGGPYVPGTHHKQVQAGWDYYFLLYK